MKAIDSNNINKIEELLKNNIITNLNKNFRTYIVEDPPLWYAIEKNNYEIVKILLKYGADVNFKYEYRIDMVLLASYRVGQSSESMKILKELLKHGANWHVKNEYGQNFLDYLPDDKKLEIIKEFPEEYDKYLIELDTKNYNL
jgi:ankyrin repeat protein